MVETAKNGKEAVKKAKKTSFNLALVDIRLPDIDGTELIEKLRQFQPKIATLILTGHPTLDNAIKSVNNKADGYLLKPFEPKILLETVEKIIAEEKISRFRLNIEVKRGKKSTPILKYQNPDKWY